MINYKIITTETWYPQIIVEKKYDENWIILSDNLCALFWEDVRNIVDEINEVKVWKREKIIFGFETTMIWCYQKWKWYYWEKYPESEVTITYNYADDYIVTDLTVEDILKMMIDWRDYIDTWEKETGKVKK